jgi:phage host-nuclease inhibitor protein Gam
MSVQRLPEIAATAIRTRDQANSALKQIALLESALAVAVGKMNAGVAVIKSKFNPEINRLGEEIAQHRAQLGAWAEEFRAKEFGESKTLKLQFGALQFRKSPPRLETLSGWDWEKCLNYLSLFSPKYVIRKPQIDKEGIMRDANEREGPGTATLSREFLREAGLKIVHDETLGIKPDPNSVLTAVPGS